MPYDFTQSTHSFRSLDARVSPELASIPSEGVDPEMLAAAKEFESVFIAQMLRHSGFTQSLTLSGGEAVAAFSDFYVQNFASKIVEDGGFGLAQKIYDSMSMKIHARSNSSGEIFTNVKTEMQLETKTENVRDIIIGPKIKGKS